MIDGGAVVGLDEAHELVHHEWGRLVWMVSAARGNSETMTVGRCHIYSGRENPRHYHPNCDEVLYVVEGTIEHTAGDQTFAMRAGDAISIPAGVVHNARNTGSDEAVLLIVFSSADRQTIAEDAAYAAYAADR